MREKVNRLLYFALSLLLAVVFWLYVDDLKGNTTTVNLTDVPIEFIGAEDTLPNRGLMLIDGQDYTMDLAISGPRMMVYDLKESDVRIQVNLTNIFAVGTYTLPFDVLTPDTVSDSSISTVASRSTVTVQVGTMYSKTVPVAVSVVGEVAEGYIYMAERLVTEPSELKLSGMAEDVDQIASARISLDLTGETKTVQRLFDYELLDAYGNVVENSGIRVSNQQVEVTAPVYATKELPLRVRIKESPGSLSEYAQCTLDSDTVLLAGEPASLENIEELVLGEVDLSTLLSDTEIPFEIPVPAGCVNLSGVNSATLSVRFRRNLEIRTFSVTNISPVGLGDIQHFSKLTNSVDVQLRGPAGSMDDLTAEDIRIVVDLTEYVSTGTYSVPAKVLVDGRDTVGAVGVYTVACKITS